MQQHIKILGILNIVMGAFLLLIELSIFLFMGGIAGIVSTQAGTDPDARIAAPVLGFIGFIVAMVFALLSIPAILTGWGLMNYKAWSRILGIVISALQLFNVPIGTALGVYGLWVLLNPESERLLSGNPPGSLQNTAPSPDL